ncbi:MAG: NOL1/NOP2/sun family putative RNA methylase [Ignavibacteriales bacterium]|nr:NOL1/NOP2/sun family putative RNA methylase [Ignavibacteriales bacterium]
MIELSSNISDYIKSVLGEDFLKNYEQFVESKYPITIRLSEVPENHNSLINSLANQGIALKKIENIPNAYEVISGEENIGKTIEHTIGKYYIQSLSSMIPPFILNPTSEDVVLDLCAAPGSKSTQLAELMEYEGTLYSNEPNLSRVKALVHNLDKMNTVNMSVIKEKGELLSKIFPNYFDKILVDAPCSALGVVQKKQEVSNWWSPKSVDVISSLQLKLLISAIKMAKVGAEIVYSTCTLTVEENEYIIDKVLKKYPVKLEPFDLNLPHVNGFTKVGSYNFDESLKLTKRIIPWELKSEGFFISKLIKTDETEHIVTKNKFTKQTRSIVSSKDKRIKKYLDELSIHFGIERKVFENYKYIVNNKDINFTNSDSLEYDLSFFLRVGTKFGIIDKSDTCKLHTHAAQILGKSATKNVLKITNENDLKTYFSGGIFQLDNTQMGQKIVKYEDYFLGTGVQLENQFKSQFPRSKRTGSISI